MASSTSLEEKQEQAEGIITSPTEVVSNDQSELTGSAEPSGGQIAAEEADSAHEQAAAENEETSRADDPPLDPRRVAALEPFLAKLGELLAQHRRLDQPSQISMAGDALYVTKWERDLTLAVIEECGAGLPGWVPRVADAVALQVKCLVDLDRLETAQTEAVTEAAVIHEDLVVSLAIGRALVVELQKVIDRSVVSGEMDAAKKLTQLRNRLKARLGHLRDVVTEEDRQRVRELGEDFLCIPGDATLPDPPKHRRRRRNRSVHDEQVIIRDTPIARESSRVRTYAVVLLALVAAWAGLVLWPAYSRKPLSELQLNDFRTVSEVSSVVARPPSLFVTLDARQWNELGEARRSLLVESVYRIAQDSGYTGVIFKTSDGRQVARWLLKRGPEIFPEGHTDS